MKIEDVKKFLKDNPEFGKAFHDHFEARREELLALPWICHALGMDKKAQIAASFIQEEILNDFGLKSISRRLERD
jgi:hypothetical protein